MFRESTDPKSGAGASVAGLVKFWPDHCRSHTGEKAIVACRKRARFPAEGSGVSGGRQGQQIKLEDQDHRWTAMSST